MIDALTFQDGGIYHPSELDLDDLDRQEIERAVQAFGVNLKDLGLPMETGGVKKSCLRRGHGK